MQNRSGGLARFADAQETVPKSAGGDAGGPQPRFAHLSMHSIQAGNGQRRKYLGVRFDAAIGGLAQLVGKLLAEPLPVIALPIEQKRAHAGGSDIETYNEVVLGGHFK